MGGRPGSAPSKAGRSGFQCHVEPVLGWQEVRFLLTCGHRDLSPADCVAPQPSGSLLGVTLEGAR